MAGTSRIPRPCGASSPSEQPLHRQKGRFALARALLAQGDRAGAQSAGARSLAQRFVLRRARKPGARGLRRPDHRRRSQGAHGHAPLCRGRRRRPCARPTAPAATHPSIAKARIAVIKKAGNAKALLDAVPAEARRDVGYIFSRAQLLRRADKAAEAGAADPHRPARPSQAIDTDQWWIERRLIARKLLDVGDPKSAYRVARDARRPEQGQLPRRAPVHRRLDRAALPQRSGDRAAPISPRSARASPTRSRWRAPAIGRAAPRKRWAARTRRAPTTRRRRNIRPPITARSRARGSASRTSCCARRPQRPARPWPSSKSCARSNSSTRSASAIWWPASLADLGERSTDTAALAAIGEVAAPQQGRPRHAAARQGGARARPCRSTTTPSRPSAFRTITPIGPAVEPAVVYAIARQESTFNPRTVSSAKAMGLMQVTPEAGRYVAKKFGVSLRREAAPVRPGLQRAAGRRRTRRPDRRIIAAPTSSPSPATMPAAAA